MDPEEAQLNPDGVIGNLETVLTIRVAAKWAGNDLTPAPGYPMPLMQLVLLALSSKGSFTGGPLSSDASNVE